MFPSNIPPGGRQSRETCPWGEREFVKSLYMAGTLILVAKGVARLGALARKLLKPEKGGEGKKR